MGNLGRAGYGGTTDGTWPFSYDACDVGTLPNQTSNGQPVAATSGGSYGNWLSYQPGQRLSACTCKGEDHPGPSVKTGRAAPVRFLICSLTPMSDPMNAGNRYHRSVRLRSWECAVTARIDMADRQISYVDGEMVGTVSQSAQFAPYNANYRFDNSSSATTVYDPSVTYINDYLVRGYCFVAVLALTMTSRAAYTNKLSRQSAGPIRRPIN